MSSLYLSTSGEAPGSAGVWSVRATDYQYIYSAFTAGQDINLDRVDVRTFAYNVGESAPNNFQVGLYTAGVNSLTPGSLISYLSGPGSPTPGAYNSYAATSDINLSAGTQYWVGFTLSSYNGGTNSTRVKVSSSTGSTSYLGSGWSYGQRYGIEGTGGGTTTQNSVRPATFQIYGTSRAVCFCSGTLISTPSGERKIDDIQIGDVVSTSHGELPVKWVAKRTVSRSSMPAKAYRDFLPIRIEAGSLADLIPHQDLLVSAAHGMLVDGGIVNACFLVNGLNIYFDESFLSRNEIRYFHLEFDDEVLVTANGVAACSYVNTSNRRTFDNYPEFVRLYLDADRTVKSCIENTLRNQISLEGHKKRVRRSWQAA